jgi:TonB family protein
MLELARTEVPSWFSIEEVAQTAGVPADDVWRLVGLGQAVVQGDSVTAADAVHLVRVLRGDVLPSAARAPFNPRPAARRKTARGFATAGLVHLTVALLLMLAPWLALANRPAAKDLPKPDEPEVKLVYLMMPGPGGGGGGGGLRQPEPPPPAKKKALVTFARRTPPVPPARPHAAPPARPAPPKPEARLEQNLVDKTPAPTPPAVQAPVKSVAADPLEVIGAPIEGPPAPPSRGPGSASGVGSGNGQGLGAGDGGGIGSGSGGGTGGGPYQPGAGIDPPTLVKEIRPNYTDAARRQAIEGDVVLEIVVRNDGSVGNVRVRRTLGAGLEQKAIEAVRQWRFIPARRHGSPVDVVVDVSVEFKLR